MNFFLKFKEGQKRFIELFEKRSKFICLNRLDLWWIYPQSVFSMGSDGFCMSPISRSDGK